MVRLSAWQSLLKPLNVKRIYQRRSAAISGLPAVEQFTRKISVPSVQISGSPSPFREILGRLSAMDLLSSFTGQLEPVRLGMKNEIDDDLSNDKNAEIQVF